MYRSRGAIRHDTTYRWKREDSFGGCKSSQPVRHMDKDTFCALKRTGIAYYRVDEVFLCNLRTAGGCVVHHPVGGGIAAEEQYPGSAGRARAKV